MVETGHFLTTTAKLLPYPKRGNAASGLATAFHHEPQPDQADLGDICAAIEVLAPAKQAAEVASLVSETAARSYYHGEEGQVLERFEDMIRAINEELAVYATHGNNAWIGKVSAVLVVIANDEVHVTQTGSAQAYLFRHGRSSCITQGLGGKEPHRPSKTFANLASGQVTSGDRLLLTTPALLHHLSLEDVEQIVAQNSATVAIQKLQQQLGQREHLDRIAATITDITTADEAAMIPQSGLSRETRLGKPESFVDLARENTAPFVARAGSWLHQRLAGLKRLWQERLAPGLKRLTLRLIQWLRKVLSGRRSRWIFLVVATIAVVGCFLLISQGGDNRALAAMAKQYHTALEKEETAASQLSNGDKLGAKSNYQSSLDLLNAIAANPKSSKLDGYLAKHRRSDDDPASLSGLRTLVSNQLDQIDGLTKVNPGQLADFAALGNAKPTLMEQVGTQLIFIDPEAGNVYRYDTTKGKLEVVANHPAKFGRAIATTPSTGQPGVLILTDTPAVWFYNSADGSLTQQTAAGDWPKGQAIGSYGGNLYILTADGISKYSRTAAGFGPKVAYSVNDASVLKDATAMAIDGSIYIGNSRGFSRIFAGVVVKSDLSIPANLTKLRAITSVDGGKNLLMVDSSSNRIGLFSFDGATNQYNGQLSINGSGTVYKVTGSVQDKSLYALVDQKLVKLSL